MQKLTKFKVIFDLFTVCVYFVQQQNCKLYYIYLMIISEIQSEIGHCSCDSAKFKAPADFSHHAILCMTLYLIGTNLSNEKSNFVNNSRAEATIIFMEKNIIFFDFSLTIFMGNPSWSYAVYLC